MVGAWAACFVWLIGTDSEVWAIRCARWMNIFAAYIPVLIAHFCAEIVEAKRRFRTVIRAGYVLAAFFTLIGPTDLFCGVHPTLQFRFYASVGPVFPFYTAHFVFYCIYGLYLLAGHYSRCPAHKQNQVNYILSGLAVGYLTGTTAFLPIYGLNIDLFLLHFVWLYAAIISYAILKHRLMDIKIVIKKTFIYSTLIFFLSAFYASIVYIANSVLSAQSPEQILSGVRASLVSAACLISPYSIPPAVTCALIAFEGVFVYKKNPGRPANQVYALFCASLCIWLFGFSMMYSMKSPDFALMWARTGSVGVVFIPVLAYHFVCAFLGYKKDKILRVLYFLSPPLLLLSVSPYGFKGVRHHFWGFYPAAGKYHFILMIVFLVGFLGALIHLVLRMAVEEDAGKVNQMKYLLAAFAVGTLGFVDYLTKYPGFEIYPWGYLCSLGLITFFGMAVVKYRLMDISLVIKKTIYYLFLTILITAVYFCLVFALYLLFVAKGSTSSIVLNFIGVLIIALTVKPFEMFLHRFLERKFFKGTIGEISEQKEILKTELERAGRLKSVGILAAGMAHEIKNPLTAIRTFSDYLPKKYDDPEFREKFSRLLSAETERISNIVQDLLIFAKPSEPLIRPCDPARIMGELADLLRPDLLKRSIQLEIKKTGCVDCLADSSQIKQVFLNILINAIDAIKAKGSKGAIHVDLYPRGRWVVVSIKDDGVGIQSHKIPSLFDPFYTEKEGGTGLGLAVTHSIVQKNRGKIEVRSVEGEETEFRVLLPSA